MASYKIFDSSGIAVATIGSSLPTADIRVCSKDHVSVDYNYRPFYCYEFAAGGKNYYVGMTGIGAGQIGLMLGSDLNRTVKAPYAFSAANGNYSVSKGETLYLYTIADNSYFTDRTRAIAAGMTVYDASGNTYTIALAYDYTVTVTTTSVSGSQVGNIAVCDASGNILAGSKSRTKSGVSTYSCTVSSTAQSVQVKIVATATFSSYTNEVTWHQKFHYAGFTQDGASIADSSIAFTSGVATYTTTISGNSSFIVSYGAKYAMTVSKGTGVSSSTLSYSRSHSTGSYVSTSTSPISLSGGGTLYVESGRTVSIAATASDGYVFYTNAITSSSSGYGNISGDGSTSISGSKVCSGATTFTITSSQFYITPSIVSHSNWGRATINNSSSSQVLKPNTTYTLGFTSSTASTYGAVVDYWSIGGVNYTTSFTTGSKITSNITAYLYLQRTKYQLTVAMSAANDDYGTVSGGGWYASGTSVNIVFKPNSTYANLGISAYQINYNGKTAACGNTATIVTGEGDYQATMFIRQTKFKMSLAYANDGTDSWGTIAADKEYVGTGDVVRLSFTPTTSLVSTIHPTVDYWTLLQQTSTPSAYSDGSSYVDVTLGTVSQDFTASCTLVSSYRKVTIRRNDSGKGAWGNFYLDSSGTTTTKYYAPGTTVALRFVRDTTYDLKDRPQVNVISVGEESTIYGVDGTYNYAYTLPTNTKSDLVISCSLKQTAYAVAVKTDGNGSLMAQRMDIGGGTVVDSVTADSTTEKTIYLRYGNETEYLALTATGKEHYGFSAWEKSNLSSYNGDVKKAYLSTAQSASVAATFARSDFLVTCATDNDAVASAYLNDSGTTSAYYSKSATQNPVVVCKIKSSYTGDYKVASWSVGSQDDIAPQYNAQGDFYYVEVTNWNDVTVTAHIVRTTFQLTVNVGPTNYAEFGSVVATAGAQTKTFSTNDDTAFTFTVRETANVSLQFYQQYGGRVLSIEKSDAISEAAIDDTIEFAMPSADCSVTFTLGEKEKYQLTVGVQNTSSGEESVIPATLEVKSRTYPKIIVGTTDASGVAQTFTMFCDEEYAIVVTAVDDTTSRRYKILGWKDGDDYISGADGDTIYLTNESTDALTRTLVYGLRETGTVTIEYAQKSGSEITTLDQIPDGCSFALTNTKDKIEGEDKWLIGADIKMPYVVVGLGFDKDGDAYKWTPIEVDIAFDDDEYSTNASWDDGLLTQSGEFVMRGNVKIRVIFVETYVPGYTAMKVGYKGNTTTRMGSVSIFATDMDAYTEDTTGASALVRKTKKAVIMAAPRPGFMFAGWWTLVDGEYVAVSGAKAVYEIAYATSPMTTYYAEFVGSTTSNVKQWNGDPSRTKTFEWQSRVYVGAQFFKMQSVRAYSDAYPVTLTIFAASSPDDIFGSNARTVTVVLADQNPRRLPKVRPEKYFAFKVQGYSRVNLVGIASSMGGLLS